MPERVLVYLVWDIMRIILCFFSESVMNIFPVHSVLLDLIMKTHFK
jgi:hypothetical protein